MSFEGKEVSKFDSRSKKQTKEDKEIIKELKTTIKRVDGHLKKFRFAQAGEVIYQFVWHEFADKYVELSKDRLKNGDTQVLTTLNYVYVNSLKLLHPFMPFVTEELWQIFAPFRDEKTPLIVSSWPT